MYVREKQADVGLEQVEMSLSRSWQMVVSEWWLPLSWSLLMLVVVIVKAGILVCSFHFSSLKGQYFKLNNIIQLVVASLSGSWRRRKYFGQKRSRVLPWVFSSRWSRSWTPAVQRFTFLLAEWIPVRKEWLCFKIFLLNPLWRYWSMNKKL